MKRRTQHFSSLLLIILLLGTLVGGQTTTDTTTPSTTYEEITTEANAQQPITEETAIEEPIGNTITYINIDELIPEQPTTEEKNTEDIIETITEEETTPEQEIETSPIILEQRTEQLIETAPITTDNTITYINIDELIPEQPQVTAPLIPEEATLEEEPVIPELIKKTLVKEGIIELAYETEEGKEIDITKKELLKEENEKVVIISSEEHFDHELTAYSDLPLPAREEDITLYWENEQEEVSVLTYEYNNDGLVSRISWMVPHLSTQTYTIIVKAQIATEAATIMMNLQNPSLGSTVTSPINFSFSVNYTNISTTTCYLFIDGGTGIYFDANITTIPNQNLAEGNHTWSATCSEGTTNATINGHFIIADQFGASMSTFYLENETVTITTTNNNNAQVALMLQRPNSTNISLGNVSTGNYTLTNNNLQNQGNYKLYITSYAFQNPTTITKDFSIGGLGIAFNTSGRKGAATTFTITINSSSSGSYDFFVGNNRIVNDRNFGSGTNTQTTFSYAPQETGNYSTTIEATINGKTYTQTGSYYVVSTDGDTNTPDVDLEYPGWEETIETEEITFSYSVSDSSNIKNCSLFIYNTTKSSSGVYEQEELLFPITSTDKDTARINNPTKDTDIEVKLVDFDEGEYLWQVECFDDYNNKGMDFNYFEVVLETTENKAAQEEVTYDREEELNELIDNINEYLTAEKNFGPEENKITEILGISTNMNLYKKRLLQMDQDLKHNLNFVEASKKETRKQEINNELDTIKENIITGLTIITSEEYSKNSLDTPLEELLTGYLQESNLESKRSITSLIRFNEELQQKLNYKTNIWTIELTYPEETKTITLINKEVELNKEFKGEIIEYLPESLGTPTFMIEAKNVGEEYWEFYEEDLEQETFSYTLEGGKDLKDIQKTETIIFEEGVREGSALTGFFTSIDFGGVSILSIILGILFCGYLTMWIFERIRIERWKKEPTANTMFTLLEQVKQELAANRVDNARQTYKDMNEVYKQLDQQKKVHFYKELSLVHASINKKDIMNLINEYEQAKDEYRKEDANLLYARINEIYRKLPKKFQDKVYRRLIKKEFG